MTSEISSHYLQEARRQLNCYKRLGDGALNQLTGEELFVTLDPESNSVALIVKHIAGNMRSRFTDFLTTDGEKPNRNRDQEFVMHSGTTQERCAHSSLFSLWEWNVKYAFSLLGRGFMDAWTTLWASWVVEQALPDATGSDRASIYFSG